MLLQAVTLFSLCGAALCHGGGDHHEEQKPIAGPHKSLWYNTLPGDGGTQVRLYNWTIISPSPIDHFPLITYRPIPSSLASRPLAAYPTFPA
jgi:hypothetical protein